MVLWQRFRWTQVRILAGLPPSSLKSFQTLDSVIKGQMEAVQALKGFDSINNRTSRFLHRVLLFYMKDNIYRERLVIFHWRHKARRYAIYLAFLFLESTSLPAEIDRKRVFSTFSTSSLLSVTFPAIYWLRGTAAYDKLHITL